MQLIDRPHFAPMGCAICGAATGPLLDTTSEIGAQQLRLYFCRAHGKEMAAVWGFVKGDEQDDLMRVREALTTEKREHEQTRNDVRTLLEANTELANDRDLVVSDRDRERQRADQLQARLDEVVESIAATANATRLVTVPADEPEDEDEPAFD